jgi:dTDP-4-dehydrorhamnose 3,5-epimerase
MHIRPLNIQGSFEITLAPRGDNRGYFMRAYDKKIFEENNLVTSWVQENQSYSKEKYTLRGMHFQKPPHAETKLVRAIAGVVFDAFVDLRKSSPTYGKWEAVTLDAAKHNMVYIPKGCAHGYLTLSEDSIVMYKVDAAYAPDAEGGVMWNDPDVAINWPIPKGTALTQSDKDKVWPAFKALGAQF